MFPTVGALRRDEVRGYQPGVNLQRQRISTPAGVDVVKSEEVRGTGKPLRKFPERAKMVGLKWWQIKSESQCERRVPAWWGIWLSGESKKTAGKLTETESPIYSLSVSSFV